MGYKDCKGGYGVIYDSGNWEISFLDAATDL
jgi:hypothetical protein